MISFYDTSTLPTEDMLEAMRQARLGDDVYHEDPTVNELEALSAQMLNKEAAIFMPSGTMSNLVAVMCHTQHGDEVVVEAEAHVMYYETGGIAAVAGVMPLAIQGERGVLRAEQIEPKLRKPNPHYPRTTLLCIENTHNRGGGTIINLQIMRELRGLCDRWGLRLHVDGARIFNAAVALNVPVSDLAADADSIWFALSNDRPLFAFAGLWASWRGLRGPKSAPVDGEHQLFGFLTRNRTRSLRRSTPRQCQ